ncbi:hypothetical protein [Streptomyces sp. NPDC051636]|uniref:hypothetical protein n=1 Tax=Streptomyces sp. NPDC051636 TaxID=3365663 RepID=UPI0037AFB9F6
MRLACSAAGLGLVLAATGLAPGVWTLTAVMTGAGLFIAPALTTAYLLAEETADPGARTQAGAWVNTAVNAGSSSGSLVAGVLIGRVPVGVCFVPAGGVALAAGVTCLAVGGAGAGAAGGT